MTVIRHVEVCLGMELSAIVKEAKVKRAIDVYEEFTEQLDFAKQLRLAAQDYLGNTSDPLRLSITPKAHEIEVTYFDHNDMKIIGFGDNAVERPKKKTAQLSIILESIFAEGNIEPDKYKITTVDIRKFALDAINTADTCIDKFAKMGGLYTTDKPNTQTVTEALKGYDLFLAQNPNASLDEKLDAIKVFAAGGKVSEKDLRLAAGVTELDTTA